MTKYEWESELKKNIHRLPKEEINRVMEYYDELFADKIERGYGETEIVSQFGNPVDVADKILSEYDGELAPADATDTPPTASDEPAKKEAHDADKSEPIGEAADSIEKSEPEEKPADNGSKNDEPPKAVKKEAKGEFKFDRFALFMVLNVLVGFAPFFVLGSVFICLVSFVAAGGAIALGGVAMTFLSLLEFGSSVGSAFAQMGMGIAMCGIGIALTVGFVKLTALIGKATGKLFVAIKNWICPQKEVAA